MPTYRDKLIVILEELQRKEGLTRYRIAERSGITQQTISNVLNGRRNFSVPVLEEFLASIGYEIAFVKSATAPSTQMNGKNTAAPAMSHLHESDFDPSAIHMTP